MIFGLLALPIIFFVGLYLWANTFTSSLKVDLKQSITLVDIIKSYARILFKVPAKGNAFPAIEISAPLTFSASHLQAYKSQLKITDSDDILPPFYLCAITGGFFLLASGHPQFPVRMLGAVNTSSEVRIHEPVQRKWLENGELKASVTIGEVQEIRRGVEFELVVKVTRGDRLVWSMIFRCLIFKKSSSTASSKHLLKEEEVIGNNTETGSGSVRLPACAGRTYAKLSGDYNPIHIHNMLAKLFGFPRAIAHGMWVVQQADARGKQFVQRDIPQAVKVFFKKPSFLPCELNVSVYGGEKANEGSFRVERLDKKKDNVVVIYGSVTKL